MRSIAVGLGELADAAPAGERQLDRLFLVVVLVVLVLRRIRGATFGRPAVRLGLALLLFAGQRADDQRRAGFVDENAVGLVDQHEVQLALHRLFVAAAGLAEHRAEQVALPLADPPLEQPIAEEVEAQFVGRAVGDVARVLLRALGLRHLRSGCSRPSCPSAS